MSDPGFHTIESKPIETPGAKDRVLVRQNRTQPGGLLERFKLASGIIIIRSTDFTAAPAAHLDRVATGESDPFLNPGYTPPALVYMLNSASKRTGSALTPLPFYDINLGTGAVGTWYDAKVINTGTANSNLQVQITIRSTDDITDTLFYWYVLDGAPDGLLNT